LAALAGEEARRVARQEGVPLLARALAVRALPFLRRAAAEGLAEGRSILGSEVEGELELADASGRCHSVRFRADLVEAEGDHLVLTDLKTGKPLSAGKKEPTRRRHLSEQIAIGKRLQAMAYALAAAPLVAERPVAGRYLFVGRPEEGEDKWPQRDYRLSPVDSDYQDLFDRASATLLTAWNRGAFTPRLLDDKLEKEGPACAWCEVREACLQGDSGARRRFARWLEETGGGDEDPLTAAARAALELHRGDD
jgi:hypothetical protein